MFTLCVACHGAKGEGNEARQGAAAGGQDDWYVASQIRKFRAGVRGTVAGDTVGPIMQAMSMTIQPENIDHLAAYVALALALDERLVPLPMAHTDSDPIVIGRKVYLITVVGALCSSRSAAYIMVS